ncbi:phage repressor protein [Ruminococcus sp. OM02-16LB]|jgi:prophage antirepressor-like protein|nr:phage repressor protein [Ruminococcus sp. OM02-16LB]DAZ40577.1 MAG TPA: repressor domain protein [Caudoviricetes sp.]
MNELQIFNSEEFGDIRTITIDNEPWFVGIDVAKSLGYANPKNAVPKHVSEEDKLNTQIEYAGQRREVTIINESGLYSLIFGSKLESAKRFKRWVTSEVLPTIRKTGSYRKPLTTVEQIQVIATGFLDHEERLNRLENTMTIDYAQQEAIRDLVSSVVIAHLGGKESNAYKEIGKKVFAECNRDIKTYFTVNARNNIPKLRFEESMEYVRNWHPCTNTVMMIRDCNAQMSIS